ncbi:MAG: hypothetical protein Q8Q97_00905 [bacterium]|nr:hypothetical protein [bacterium]
MAKYGKIAGQILELLATGSLLGFSRDKRVRRGLLNEADKIWYSIDRKALNYILHRFKLQNYIESIKDAGNIEKIRLTNRGRARTLAYHLNNLKLPVKKKWDKKWRFILFDIPEPKKKIRDALRRKLKQLGFLEFQKSVFIYPYPCNEEINFILNFYNIPEHVYYIEAPITPDVNFRNHFKL